MSTSRLPFGIYPFSVAGMGTGAAVGAPDNVEHIQRLLQELQGDANTFIPRSYILYAGADSAAQVLAQVEYYVLSGLKWDVVLCFSDAGGKLDGWLNVIRMVVQRYGSCLAALQITNEPNLSLPGKNVQPNVRQALVRGVMTAKEAARAFRTRFVHWTTPLTSSLPLGTLADLARSKSELMAENALLRQQLIILKRQVKRPACTKADRVFLVLLARVVRTWKQALFIVQPDTRLALAS